MTATNPAIPEFTIHDRFRKAREHAGLSRENLAEEIDVSVRTIARYENGEVTPRRLVAKVWALRCGVDLDWLWAARGSNPEPADSLLAHAA